MRGPGEGTKPGSLGSEKSHLLGASPCSSTRQGGPLYGWKKRGIFAVVGSGQRGQGFASTYARCPHTGPRCLSPVEADGCLLLDASVLRGQGRAWALPGDTGHRALREFHGKSPAQGPGIQVCP